MSSRYSWLPLSEIVRYEPEMKRLKVSTRARSASGFLSEYKRVGGDPDKMSDWWKRRRDGFVARHMSQYKYDRGYRRWLSLIAWAYRPAQPPRPH